MNEVAVRLRGLCVGYGGADVVSGVDLSVARGEVVALLGANGAGKTTVLESISGFLSPTAGSVELLGQGVQSVGNARRRRREVSRRARLGLGHVPQDRALFAQLTVAQHLQLAVPRREATAAVDRGVALFAELAPLLGRTAQVLSGGEQQMLAIARAVVAQPNVLMIDELSTGLAPELVRRIMGSLRQLADESSTAVLVVEQHVAAVLEVADRLVVLRRGEVALDDAPRAVIDDPSLVTAVYLGR